MRAGEKREADSRSTPDWFLVSGFWFLVVAPFVGGLAFGFWFLAVVLPGEGSGMGVAGWRWFLVWPLVPLPVFGFWSSQTKG